MSYTAEDRFFISNLTSLSDQFAYYSCLTFVNVGYLSNILNIVVCSRKKLRKTSMGFYNITMSIFNILNFVMGYLQYFPETIGNPNLYFVSSLSCALISYILRCVVQMSAWLNVMVSFDRTLCLWHAKNRFKSLKNKTKLFLIVLSLCAVICAINLPNAFYNITFQTTLDSATNQTSTETNCAAPSQLIGLVRDTIGQVMRSVLPVILEAILSTLLVYKIIKTRKNLNSFRPLSREYKFAFTIVMLNVTFLVTQTPLLILTFYVAQQSSATPREMAIAKFAYKVALLFSAYLFSSIFFVNVFFNKQFLKEIYNLCGFVIYAFVKKSSTSS